LQNIVSRNNGAKLKAGDVKALKTDRVAPHLADNDDLALAGKVSKEAIDFLTVKIKAIERAVEGKVKLREPYDRLLDVPGIGKTLALTIMLETGPISRFDQVGNFVTMQKPKRIRKAAINIWLGPSPRRPSWHAVFTMNPGRITTGRRKERIS
jgi:transposase